MTRRSTISRRTALALGAGAAALVGGCQQTETSGSRVKAYTSLAMLAKDATDIVVARAIAATEYEAETAGHPEPYVLCELEVDRALTPGILGATYTHTQRLPAIRAGQQITVLQWGASDNPNPDSAILTEGIAYLLFLIPTNLPADTKLDGGDFSAWYYPVGATAGIYVASGDGSFDRALGNDFDTVPGTIEPTDVRALS